MSQRLPKQVAVSVENWQELMFLKIKKNKRDINEVIKDLLDCIKLTDYRTTKNSKGEKKPFSSLNGLKT